MIDSKSIPDFPKYVATRWGKIYSFTQKSRGGEIKQCTTRKGYKVICIYRNGGRFIRFVHRLILETFIGNCPKGLQCRHLNGNKEDNALTNLCWGTAQENVEDKIKHKRSYNRGERHPRALLNKQEVRLIFHSYHDGVHTMQELANFFNISKSAVNNIVSQRTWRYLWL